MLLGLGSTTVSAGRDPRHALVDPLGVDWVRRVLRCVFDRIAVLQGSLREHWPQGNAVALISPTVFKDYVYTNTKCPMSYIFV